VETDLDTLKTIWISSYSLSLGSFLLSTILEFLVSLVPSLRPPINHSPSIPFPQLLSLYTWNSFLAKDLKYAIRVLSLGITFFLVSLVLGVNGLKFCGICFLVPVGPFLSYLMAKVIVSRYYKSNVLDMQENTDKWRQKLIMEGRIPQPSPDVLYKDDAGKSTQQMPLHLLLYHYYDFYQHRSKTTGFIVGGLTFLAVEPWFLSYCEPKWVAGTTFALLGAVYSYCFLTMTLRPQYKDIVMVLFARGSLRLEALVIITLIFAAFFSLTNALIIMWK